MLVILAIIRTWRTMKSLEMVPLCRATGLNIVSNALPYSVAECIRGAETEDIIIFQAGAVQELPAWLKYNRP